MTGAQYFIEQFIDTSKVNGKAFQSPTGLPIELLDRSLDWTKSSRYLRTVAIWKIKLKPGVVIAVYDSEVNA